MIEDFLAILIVGFIFIESIFFNKVNWMLWIIVFFVCVIIPKIRVYQINKELQKDNEIRRRKEKENA